MEVFFSCSILKLNTRRKIPYIRVPMWFVIRCPSVLEDRENLRYNSVCGWVAAPAVAAQENSRSAGLTIMSCLRCACIVGQTFLHIWNQWQARHTGRVWGFARHPLVWRGKVTAGGAGSGMQTCWGFLSGRGHSCLVHNLIHRIVLRLRGLKVLILRPSLINKPLFYDTFDRSKRNFSRRIS